jgi:hypothetical protein
MARKKCLVCSDTQSYILIGRVLGFVRGQMLKLLFLSSFVLEFSRCAGGAILLSVVMRYDDLFPFDPPIVLVEILRSVGVRWICVLKKGKVVRVVRERKRRWVRKESNTR